LLHRKLQVATAQGETKNARPPVSENENPAPLSETLVPQSGDGKANAGQVEDCYRKICGELQGGLEC